MKRYLKPLCCAAAMFLLLQAPARAESKQAKSLLEKAMKYAEGLDSLSLAVDMSLALQKEKDGPTERMEVECSLTLRGKDELHMKVILPSESAEIYSDGKKMTIHEITGKSYMEDAPPPRARLVGLMPGGAIRMGSVYLGRILHNDTSLLEEGDLEYLGKEEVDVLDKNGEATGKKVSCHHIRLAKEDEDVDFWIQARKDPVVRKFTVDPTKSFDYDAAPDLPARAWITFQVYDWRPNAKLAADRFAFVPPEGTSLRTPGQDPLVGRPAPNFKLDLLSGETFELAKYKGKKIVILDFWASWCGPCRIGLPIVAEVAKAYADRDVVLYAVNLQESPELNRSFLESSGLDIQVALDVNGAAGRMYLDEMGSIPRTIIIGKDGIVRQAHSGFSPPTFKRQLEAELNAIIAEGEKKDGGG